MGLPLYDAQAALSFVLSQISHIESAVNEVVYADIQYPSLIPVDTTADPFTKTVTYFGMDKFGTAKWMSGNAKDIPMAGTELAKYETAVYTAGIGYGYGWEEINQAMRLGRSLANDDAIAARRAYEEFVDNIALNGDATKAFLGLKNNTAITPVAATTGTWSTATPDEILGDINQGLTAVATATLQVRSLLADTVLLPYAEYLRIASTARSSTSDTTILEFIRRNNAYTALTGTPITIQGMRGLETAGAAGVQRMIVYRRDPMVLKLHLPMPHRFLPVQQMGLRYEIPGVFRMGGLDIRYPNAVKYIDGI